MPNASKRTRRAHNIYVIELDKEVLRERKFREANPEYDETKPCVYVGMSGRPPEERFEQHLSGYRATRYVRRYGIRLKPRLYQRFNPYDEACEKERWRARTLRKKGYGVWQN